MLETSTYLPLPSRNGKEGNNQGEEDAPCRGRRRGRATLASSLGAEEVRRPVPTCERNQEHISSMEPTNRLQRGGEGQREAQTLTLKGVAEEEVDGDGVGVHGAAAAAVAVCISPPERRNYVRGGGPWLDSGRELE
jgi:hypothetical protein